MFADLRGRGGFGEVFDACFQVRNGARMHVAVKKLDTVLKV